MGIDFKKQEVFLGFIAVVIVIFSLGSYFKSISERKSILGDFATTTGRITRYVDLDNSDLRSGRDITYEYNVDSILFERDIHTMSKLSKCKGLSYGKGLPEECKQKKFWVLYSKKDPSLSLINFSMEIQDVPNPKLPESEEGFY